MTFQEVFATLYHNLGIDARRTTIVDTRGRPQYLADHGEPMRDDADLAGPVSIAVATLATSKGQLESEVPRVIGRPAQQSPTVVPTVPVQ